MIRITKKTDSKSQPFLDQFLECFTAKTMATTAVITIVNTFEMFAASKEENANIPQKIAATTQFTITQVFKVSLQMAFIAS